MSRGCCVKISKIGRERYNKKASENKNAILVFAFQTPQHFTHLG